MSVIRVENLSFDIDKTKILDNISFDVPKGAFVGVVGPNGCGKSSLLKNIYKSYRPTKGAIYINDKNLFNISNKNFAKEVAVVTQEHELSFDFTVEQIVEMSRYAHHNFLYKNTNLAKEICEKALEDVGMLDFRERSYLSLSGGEKQRVMIAMAFAKGSKIILLDEPTNHLDIGYQLSIMDTLKNREDTTIFATIHDLNIAAKYCDYIFLMEKSRIINFGKPRDVLDVENINKLFMVNSYINELPDGNFNISFLGQKLN